MKRCYFVLYRAVIQSEKGTGIRTGSGNFRLFKGALPSTAATKELKELLKQNDDTIRDVIILNYKRLWFFNWDKDKKRGAE